jgi:hypothetical protein
VKNVVYRQPINTEEELRVRNEEAFTTITLQVIMDSKLSLLRLSLQISQISSMGVMCS